MIFIEFTWKYHAISYFCIPVFLFLYKFIRHDIEHGASVVVLHNFLLHRIIYFDAHSKFFIKARLYVDIKRK